MQKICNHGAILVQVFSILQRLNWWRVKLIPGRIPSSKFVGLFFFREIIKQLSCKSGKDKGQHCTRDGCNEKNPGVKKEI